MAQDISFHLSEPFTPNATIVPTPTQDVSIYFLVTRVVRLKQLNKYKPVPTAVFPTLLNVPRTIQRYS